MHQYSSQQLTKSVAISPSASDSDTLEYEQTESISSSNSES